LSRPNRTPVGFSFCNLDDLDVKNARFLPHRPKDGADSHGRVELVCGQSHTWWAVAARPAVCDAWPTLHGAQRAEIVVMLTDEARIADASPPDFDLTIRQRLPELCLPSVRDLSAVEPKLL
jgi:hypothetical protein